MRAAVLVATNAPLEIMELTVPPLGAGQVLVRMAASGLCASQLLEIRGLRGEDKYVPHVLGHEGAGVVEDIGAGVCKVKAGDHVVVSWIKGSGMDTKGPIYHAGERVINAGPIATFAERVVVAENRVTAISKELPLDLAATLACSVATGTGAVWNAAVPEVGETVAIFGIGGVGVNAVQAAVFAGASTVIAVDTMEEKLLCARQFGATATVNAATEDVVERIRQLTNGRGVDVAIEASGARRAMETAFAATRTQGGRTILAGNLPAGQTISIDPFSLIAGKKLRGTWGGETNPDRDFPRLALLALEGKIKLAELITARFPLTEINAAVAAFVSGDHLRVLVMFG